MEKNSIKEKIGDAISSRAKGVSVPIAAISAALLFMSIGAITASVSAQEGWYNPEVSGHSWGPGGQSWWHQNGGEYGGYFHHQGPWWRGGMWGDHDRGTIMLHQGESLHYQGYGPGPHVICGFGGHGGFYGDTEENYRC
jgi:hypothetical protein